MRILVVYYSHSGTVAKVTERFCRPLKRKQDVHLFAESLEPNRPYPFPWKTLPRLLRILPECQLGLGGGVKPLSIGPEERFDLVILSYQVWHLAPSLPIQDFLNSEYAQLLRQTPVVTICVSRNTWHSASERMKLLLDRLHAIHVDNIIVTHEGPPLATLVSVPRFLLFGKKDLLWGVFPPAEIAETELERVEHLGTVLVGRLRTFDRSQPRPMLIGEGAVRVNRHYILAELIAARSYFALARLAVYCERYGLWVRHSVVNVFIIFLLPAIIFVVPFTILLNALAYVFAGSALEKYAMRLAQPSGEALAPHESFQQILERKVNK